MNLNTLYVRVKPDEDLTEGNIVRLYVLPLFTKWELLIFKNVKP